MSRLLFQTVTAVCAGWIAVTACALEFRAGAAKVDITPAEGVSLDGPISKNGTVTSIHDPLHARALVLDDGRNKLAIVVCDACMIGQDVFEAAKTMASQKTGIPRNHLLLTATHTHAAPRATHIGREPIDDEYHESLARNIADAVIQANQQLEPAQVGYSSFQRPGLIACRRFLCKPGSVGPNPFGATGEQIKSVAGTSTDVIKPAGPTDPEFSVLYVRHADGSPLCLLGNFSVHYCGGYQRGAVSADYFGVFCDAIEASSTRSTHHPLVGIMSNGTSGNTGAFQRIPDRRFAAFEGMQFWGRTLAEAALQQIETLEFEVDPKLTILETELALTIRRPSAERLKWADSVLRNPQQKQPHRWAKVYAQEAKHLNTYPSETNLKLQAVRIGEIAVTACPCEVFAETGLAIKSASPFEKTFNMELANGYAGYLPPREQHELGGYETWPARSSFLEVDAEQKIRERLVDMLQSLK